MPPSLKTPITPRGRRARRKAGASGEAQYLLRMRTCGADTHPPGLGGERPGTGSERARSEACTLPPTALTHALRTRKMNALSSEFLD